MLHRNLGGKNLGLTNKYAKFGQLIIGKIIKMLHFKAKMYLIRFLASVRSFVRLLDGV